VLEAQASGLPVVAVNEGGPASLIEHGETGMLVEPESEAIADALLSIVSGSWPRERLVRNALAAVSERTWESSLDKLAAGYPFALDQRTPGRARSVA
jgi:glycosyltransferase involved in cell wall biosynthesis